MTTDTQGMTLVSAGSFTVSDPVLISMLEQYDKAQNTSDSDPDIFAEKIESIRKRYAGILLKYK